MEKTLFEQAGVKHREVDGLFFPILPADMANISADVGKYGRMWLHFLFEINRREYNRRLLEGTLIDDAVGKNEEAYGILDFVTQRELERISVDKKNSSLEMYKCRMAVKVTAEEEFIAVIMQDFNNKRSGLQDRNLSSTQQNESED